MRQTTTMLVALLMAFVVASASAQRGRASSRPTPQSPRSSTVTGPPGQVAGRVVRPDGLPQPDADVVLANRTQRGALVQLPWRARTGFDGRYEIARVPPGRYLVLVRPIGADVAPEGRPDATLFPGVPPTEPGAPVDVLPGLSTEGVDVWLVPAPRRFSVSGRVFGPEGTRFDDLVIEMGRPNAKATDVSTITDPGGLFTIEPVPPGTFVLRARATVGGEVLTGLVATAVAVQAVEDVRITVRDAVPVSGRVRAEGDALPANLRVSLVPTLLGPTALYPADEVPVAADGGFTVRAEAGRAAVVVRGLPPGWDVLTVTPGDAGSPPTVAVSAGSRASSLEVVVGPRGQAAGPNPQLTGSARAATVGATATTGGR